MTLVCCAACTAHFFVDYSAPPYADVLLHPSMLQYYVEQGAGVDIMLGPLSCVPRERVRTFLEIGCGFGFGVDFAQRQLGWTARGIDPSFFATEGRRLLGANLDVGYWAPREGETFDLIYGSEVIEHLTDPGALIAQATRALSAEGAIVLTTPNAEILQPAAPALTSYAILSPGFHAVLFTGQALETLFHRAGLRHVRVWKRDATLIACASRTALPEAGAPVVNHTAFAQYLEGRLLSIPQGTPLACGFAYRLFKHMMNAGDYVSAERALLTLAREVQTRFGVDVASPAAVEQTLAQPLSLDDFAVRCPFNIVGVMHFQGMLELNARARPARAYEFFEAGVRAGAAVRHALSSVGASDGESEDLSALDRALAREAAARSS